MTSAKSQDAVGADVHLLRRNAIDVHRAFSELNPVIHRTRMLSLNAVVASARTGASGESFGIIAKELTGVASELSRLIGEMESLFRTVVGHVARGVQDETRCRLYRRALQHLREGDGQAMPGNSALLEEQAARNRTALVAGLGEVEAIARQLVQRIHRINWVAVRQSHITGVAAQIEAARAPKASGLQEVARIVRDLAAQIATTESAAKQKIEDLEALATAVVKPLHEGAHGRSHAGAA